MWKQKEEVFYNITFQSFQHMSDENLHFKYIFLRTCTAMYHCTAQFALSCKDKFSNVSLSWGGYSSSWASSNKSSVSSKLFYFYQTTSITTQKESCTHGAHLGAHGRACRPCDGLVEHYFAYFAYLRSPPWADAHLLCPVSHKVAQTWNC